MVEFLAGIATILGFTMQVCDKISGAKTDDEALLLFLRQLSIKSKSIKEIHLKYHALSNDMRVASVYLSAPIFYRKTKKGEINDLKNTLKVTLQAPALLSAQYNLVKVLRPCFKNMRIDSQAFDVFDKGDDCEVISYLERILNAQDEIEKMHLNFCEVMKHIGQFPLDVWGDSEIDYIKTNHRVFVSDFYVIIDYADQILMAYLEIYQDVCRKYEKYNK